MIPKFLIMADDFTGANDTGVQLTKKGMETLVELFPTDKSYDHSVVVDSESRTIPEKEAYKTVYTMSKTVLKNNDFDVVYKKIDSTIRGNISKEILAMADAYQPSKIVVAPAYPKINRTTENSIHKLNGTRLMETEIKDDPLNPLVTDNLEDLLSGDFDDIVTHSINDLKSLDEGYVHIFDVVDDKDLKEISRKCLKSSEKILYVGSAGLCEYLAEELIKKKPALAVVGSISRISLEQMNYSEQQGDKVVQVLINDLIKETGVKEYSKMITEYLDSGHNVVLTATRKRGDYQETVESFSQLKSFDKAEISRLVREKLAEISHEVVKDYDLAGLFLTGGDTAIEIIDALEGTGSKIKDEVSTGVVFSELSGGSFEGLNLITKAGAFGEESTLYEALLYLNRKGVN